MTTYATNITLAQDTVDKLTDGNFSLYGFKAVKATSKGSPLVWFATKTFSLTTALQWEEKYNAYTSRTEIKPNTRITASASYAADLKQTLNVTSPSGTGSIDTLNGVDGAIAINNETSTPFSCGLSQTDPNGNVSLMCAFDLYGNTMDVIAPIETILLLFATAQLNTGTVIEKAFTSGLIIDLTGAPAVGGVPTRNVSFDINNGWSWPDNAAWGKQVPPKADLVPLLIQNSAALKHLMVEQMHM
jgi:hypothetical protein